MPQIRQNESYSQQQDIKNTLKMREIMSTLPSFCRDFFRGIAENTEARTRLAYAYDLRVFFECLHDTNSALKNTGICDLPLSFLDMITKSDIEEFLEYTSYYEKDGKIFDELNFPGLITIDMKNYTFPILLMSSIVIIFPSSFFKKA